MPEPKKRGRPRKDIDPAEVEKLAMLQCTYREVAAFFGCDEKTIRNNFSAEMNVGREKGKISLRRKQWKLAEHNASMAIFLGKNTLDQRDRQELQHTGKDGGPLQVTVTVVNKPKESAE